MRRGNCRTGSSIKNKNNACALGMYAREDRTRRAIILLARQNRRERAQARKYQKKRRISTLKVCVRSGIPSYFCVKIIATGFLRTRLLAASTRIILESFFYETPLDNRCVELVHSTANNVRLIVDNYAIFNTSFTSFSYIQ